jgi:hypothetical protein
MDNFLVVWDLVDFQEQVMAEWDLEASRLMEEDSVDFQEQAMALA